MLDDQRLMELQRKKEVKELKVWEKTERARKRKMHAYVHTHVMDSL